MNPITPGIMALERLRLEALGLNEENARSLSEIERLERSVMERDQGIENLRRETLQLSAEIRFRDQALQRHTSTSQSLLREAALSLSEKQAEVAALRSSNSWKITEPIRRLVSWGRGR